MRRSGLRCVTPILLPPSELAAHLVLPQPCHSWVKRRVSQLQCQVFGSNILEQLKCPLFLITNIKFWNISSPPSSLFTKREQCGRDSSLSENTVFFPNWHAGFQSFWYLSDVLMLAITEGKTSLLLQPEITVQWRRLDSLTDRHNHLFILMFVSTCCIWGSVRYWG